MHGAVAEHLGGHQRGGHLLRASVVLGQAGSFLAQG
jgi:hypothetical protein